KGFLIAGSTIGVSVPNFVFALLLMIIFGVQLQFFPIIGLSSPASYVLPVIAQSVYPIAVISRLVNTTFSEALKQDHVIMARAKGLKEVSIIFKHVLKNSMVPVVTYLGPTIAFLLTGSFVIESLYTIPGLGMEFVNSISNRDYTVILGLSIFIGTVIIIANMLVDVICAFIDPRIKLS
ncbi:MAG TPA: ABC transporter permease, partial [Clostridium sp.]|nr:ABC transporter permease [Clostridium sp.]